TMSDLSEIEAAVRAARAEAPDLPVVATLSFDTNLRTMMGVSPALAVTTLADLGVDVIGANCGRGLDEMRIIAAQLAEARPEGVRLIVQSNAGLPKLVGDSFEFDGTPQEMAVYAVEMRDLGFDIIGACCGSTPSHIAAMRGALT
ncbi:MAG: homocysteine S-methyltransferase family protein, partial [Candidatus Nanopelagicales bacterium]